MTALMIMHVYAAVRVMEKKHSDHREHKGEHTSAVSEAKEEV
jgi:hypothetical protein